MLDLILVAALAAQPAGPDRIFACSFGARRAEIISDGTTLTYRFGRPGKPELVLSGNAATGTVFYHRTLYPRGEAQTLRFNKGAWDYVVFNVWMAPSTLSTGVTEPEYNDSGVLVLRDGQIVSRLKCRSGGELREWPVFKGLPQDAANLAEEEDRE